MSLQVDGVSIKKPRPPRPPEPAPTTTTTTTTTADNPSKPDAKIQEDEIDEGKSDDSSDDVDPGCQVKGAGAKKAARLAAPRKRDNDKQLRYSGGKPLGARAGLAATLSAAIDTPTSADSGVGGASNSAGDDDDNDNQRTPISAGTTSSSDQGCTVNEGANEQPPNQRKPGHQKCHPYSQELARINIINKHIANRHRADQMTHAGGTGHKLTATRPSDHSCLGSLTGVAKDRGEGNALDPDLISDRSSVQSKLAKTLSRIKESGVAQNVRFSLYRTVFDRLNSNKDKSSYNYI